MIFIFCAIKAEADLIIDSFGLKRDTSVSGLELYGNGNILLALTGIGKVRCAATVARVLTYFNNLSPVVLNIGICAGGKGDKKGDIFHVNKITDLDTSRSYYPDMIVPLGIPEKASVTVSVPSLPGDLKDREEITDMESSAFIETASMFTSKDRIFLVKIVSDFGEEITVSSVYSLLEGRREEILRTVDTLLGIKEEEDIPEYDISSLSEALHCTEYMKNRLREISSYLISTGKDPKEYFAPFLPVASKAEGKKVLDEAVSHLY